MYNKRKLHSLSVSKELKSESNSAFSAHSKSPKGFINLHKIPEIEKPIKYSNLRVGYRSQLVAQSNEDDFIIRDVTVKDLLANIPIKW